MATDRTRYIQTYQGTEYLSGSEFPRSENYLESDRRRYLGGIGHYGFPNFPSGKNVGGPFFLKGQTLDHFPSETGEYWAGGAANQHYVGKLYTNLFGAGMPSATTSTDSRVSGDGWGPAAYDRMKPTKPTFPGLNAIYELREVPEMLRQRFLNSGLKGISNYWLALQFGWKPLLSDLRALVDFQRKAQKKLDWLLKHNGKPVRTRVELVHTKTTPVETVTRSYDFRPGLSTLYFSGSPTSISRTWSEDHIWASARWLFFLPDGPRDIIWKRAMLARLFGLQPTPSVIWNALPWTWLSDWFLTTGDILSNLDAGVADRLAAECFYLMRENTSFVSKETTGRIRRADGSYSSVSASAVATSFTKWRESGDPFGWHTQAGEGLSAMQLSILGALGMSRLR